MYKALLPALFIIGISATSNAQSPTLTAATNNPIYGDEFITVNCDTSGVTPQSAGVNQVWDFSSVLFPMSLFPLSSDTGFVVTPNDAPNGSMFPSSNVAIYTPSSGTTGSMYYVASPTAFSQDGAYSSSTNYAELTDPMDLLRYPFSYPDNFTDTYSGTIYFMGIVPATQSGTISVSCDGYGTLILPGFPVSSTYNNTLRVHSTQNYTDHANLFGVDTSATFQLETYTWYTPGYHNALLTIATATGAGYFFKQVSYSAFENPAHESVGSVTDLASSLNIFPDPAHDMLNIAYNTSSSAKTHITLTDMLGREVGVIAENATGSQNISYNISSLSGGIYFVRLQSGSQVVNRKVVIQ